MTDHDDIQHRAYHQSDPDRITVRDDSDGIFTVRMPIASTGEVRNEGDDPLERDEIEGMAQQIEERAVGVFLDHGTNRDVSASRYGATGKVGEWANPEVVEGSGEDLLEADARFMDPETLPDTTGSVRKALSVLQAQVDRGFSLSSSIGWREDEDAPGGNDLMEASIVGIGADPRTTSQDASPAAAMARAAVASQNAAEVMGASVSQAFRELTEQQTEMALDLLEQFVEEQGNASVRNFESWLWEVDDDNVDENAIHAAHTALEDFYRAHSPMDDPVDDTFRSWLEGQSGDDSNEQDMSDDSNESGEQSDDTTEEQNSTDDAEEFREFMREQTETQTEILRALSDAIRQDDEDDEDDEDEDDEEEDEENEGDHDDEDDDDEQSSDGPDDTQSIDVDGDEVTAADVRELRGDLATAREDDAVETDDEQDSSEADEQRDTDTADSGGWL